MTGCGAPDQSGAVSVDLANETVIKGAVRTRDTASAVAGAYVRLLDSTGEFAAEVVSGPEGQFRFFAAPGAWTVRALSRRGTGEAVVTAEQGLNQVVVTITDQ
jgi:hypothetical protein